MAKDRRKLQHIHSSVPDKQPTAASLEVGEIAVNNAKNQEFLSLKNSDDKVVRFSSDDQIIDWVERKEVIPYDAYTRGSNGPGGSTGPDSVTESDLLQNKSNIIFKFNQVAAENTVKHDKINGAKDIYGLDVNPTSDGGITDGAGFAVDMSRYAMIGANPSFSSVTVTHRSNLSGTTIISNGAGGNSLNINTTNVTANNTNWTETVTNKNETITNRTTQVGTENLTVTGTTTETHNGNVTENNKANYTVNTTGITEMSSTGNTCIKSQADADFYGKNNTKIGVSCGGDVTTKVTAEGGDIVINAITNNVGITAKKDINITSEEDININSLNNVCIGGGENSALFGEDKTDIGVNCDNSLSSNTTNIYGDTVTINANSEEHNVDNFIIEASSAICLTGGASATMGGDVTTNVGTDCAGSPISNVTNIYGDTINNSGDTINNKAKTINNSATTINNSAVTINNSAQTINTTAKTENHKTDNYNVTATSAFNVSTSAACIIADSSASIGGDVATNVGTNCAGSPISNVTNIYGDTINNSGDTINNKAKTINNSATTINNSAQTINTTAKTENHKTENYNVTATSAFNVSTSAACIMADATASMGGDVATNVGTNCAGSPVSNVTNIYGDTINNSGDTINNKAKIINNSATTINNSAVTINNSATTINTTAKTENHKTENYNVTATSAFNVSTSAACIMADATASMGGDVATNVGTDCAGSPVSNITNIYGDTINNSGDTINNKAKIINNSATTINNSAVTINNSAQTINTSAVTENHVTSAYNVTTNSACIVGASEVNLGGNQETNIGADCGGDVYSKVVNIDASSAITLSSQTINSSSVTENHTSTTENHNTENYNVTASAACIVGASEVNLGAKETNIGTDCGGNVVASSVTINSTSAISMSSQTINTSAITENHVTSAYNVTSKSACIVGANEINLGAADTNIGTDCGGDIVSSSVTINSSSSITINTPTTYISGDTIICGTTYFSGETYFSADTVHINISCDALSSTTLDDAFCESFNRSIVNVTGSSRNNNNTNNTFQTYTVRQDNANRSVNVEIPNVKVTSAQTSSPQTDSTYRTVNVTYSATTRGGVAIPNVTVTPITTDLPVGILKQYDIKYDGVSRGVIDIPKDFLVKSGSVIMSGGTKYIDLVLNTKDESESGHVYVNVNDLVVDSVYTSSGKTLTATYGYNTTSGVQVVNYDVANPLKWALGTPTANSTGYNGSSAQTITIPSTTDDLTNNLKYVKWALGTPSADTTGYNGSADKTITIPSKISNLTNDLKNLTIETGNTYVSGSPYNGSSEAKIVVPKNISNLSGRGILTVQKNGSNVGTYDPSGNSTVNITVPTAVSSLTRSALTIETGNTYVSGSPFDCTSPAKIVVPKNISNLSGRGVLTIQKNGSNVGTYDPSGDSTVNITVPTTVCDLTRGSLTLKQGTTTLGTYDPCSGATISIPTVEIPSASTLHLCYGSVCGSADCVDYNAGVEKTVTIPATISDVTCGDITDASAGTASNEISAKGKNIRVTASSAINIKGGSTPQAGGEVNIDAFSVKIGKSSNDTNIYGNLVVVSGNTNTTIASRYGNIYIKSGSETEIDAKSGFTVTTSGDASVKSSKEIVIQSYAGTNNSGVTATFGSGCLTINGNVCVNGKITADNAIYSSDEKLKENIDLISYEKAISAKEIKLKSFNFKDDTEKRTTYGVIAQEVIAAGFDELVHTREDGTLGVDYISLLILKNAQQHYKIMELEHEIFKLKSSLNFVIKELEEMNNNNNGK